MCGMSFLIGADSFKQDSREKAYIAKFDSTITGNKISDGTKIDWLTEFVVISSKTLLTRFSSHTE
jgi:hypothetical protein